MSSAVAKKYAKALMSEFAVTELSGICATLSTIGAAQQLPKYQDIVLSPDVTLSQKGALILSLGGVEEGKLKNFLLLLAEKKRLDLIADIASEIQVYLDEQSGTAEGFVDTASQLSESELQSLQAIVSSKVGLTLSLSLRNSSYEGLKVEIPSLGKEIELNAQSVKRQMIEHILKAI